VDYRKINQLTVAGMQTTIKRCGIANLRRKLQELKQMSSPALLGIATGVPPYRHTQEALYNRWLSPLINSQRAGAIFKAAEIETRHSVLDTSDFLETEPGTEARNKIYMESARRLGATSIQTVLARTGLTVTEIDHFLVISCTGLDTPGLDVRLAADLGMRPDLRRSALIGMGCHAGLTGIDRAMLELAARPGSYALILSVEFGTLHFQHGKKIENMIAAAIFGDGVAAAVVGPASAGKQQLQLLNTATYSDYTRQDLMGFHLSDTGFQIHLSTKVARVLGELVPGQITNFLNEAGLSPEDITFWAIHPGGARILDQVGQALSLTEQDLRFSRSVLRNYGNMSSTTIFFVLDEIFRTGDPRPGDFVLLQTFGPGFTIEMGLARWT
jgi:predicted naringenin-chalcone synthase